MKKKATRRLNSQKLIASTVSAAVVISPLGGSFTADAAVKSFKDVSKDAYYYKAVQDLVEKGVIDGYPDGTFKPNNAVTRAEFSALLTKILDLNTDSVNNPNFKDVHTNAWYYNAVAALANQGLVGGYEDGTFQPNKQITRAEIAALLTRVCNLSADGQATLPFADVPANSWYKEVVTALYQSKLVSGKTNTTFAPNDHATRAEATVFLHRADSQGLLPALASASINTVTNEAVTIGGVSYKIADNLKGIFNTANSSILKDGKISFVSSNQTITKITSLELTASGQAVGADEVEFSKNVVLDGGNNTIDGNVKVAGNYVSIKNVKIAGDFEIGKELQNDFYSENISVSEKTTINGGDNNTVVFTDAALNTVEVNKQDVNVAAKGKTTIKEVVVTKNATITGDDSAVISKVTVNDGVDKLDLKVKVDNVVVDTTKEMSLYGKKIGTLELVKSTKITLVKGTKVENLILPADVAAKDIIKNYNDVKKDIAKINGKNNPDAATGGGGGGGGGGSVTTPDDINSGKTINGNYTIDIDKESALTFGPASGTTTITGDLTIKGDAEEIITLRNIIVKGTLTVNIPKGTVKLADSVTVSKTDLKDVRFGTFSSEATHTGAIDVQDDDAVIELNGAASNANVDISGGGTIQLKGTFKGNITVNKAVNLSLAEGATLSNIAIQAAGVELTIPTGASIDHLKVEAADLKLGGSGVADILDKIEVIGDYQVAVDESQIPEEKKDLLLVFNALNALTWNDIKGDNGALTEKIGNKKPLNLIPTIDGFNGVNVKWESDAIDTTTGKITKDGYEGPITLTATLSKGDYKLTKQYIINLDTVAPVVGEIQHIEKHETSAKFKASSNETGKLYYLVKEGTVAPTIDEITGEDGKSVAVTANEDTTFEVTNLEPGTAYTIYVVAEDELGNIAATPKALSFKTYAVGQGPKISSISFGDVITKIDGDNTFEADLRKVTSNTVFSATVKVTQTSNLQLSIENLGTIGDFGLTEGVDNTIDNVDFSKVNANNINFEEVNFTELLNVLLANPDVNKAALYDAIKFGEIFTIVSDKDSDTLQALLANVDINKIFDAVKGTGTASDIYNIVDFAAINDVVEFTDFVDKMAVFNILTKYEEFGELKFSDLSNPKKIIETINASDKKAEIYSDLYALIDFNQIFNTMLNDSKYGKESVRDVFRALHVEQLLAALDEDAVHDVFATVDLNKVFEILGNSSVRSEIFNGDVINLPAIFAATGKSQGFTKDLFDILEKFDGEDDNTLTVGARLYNDNGETPYTIKMVISD
ncbi:putative S-layer protein [Schinkia azotoformans MEV2011]|uniref:Putative S-layer protein n=1 Tax=Schinkia azotoformans MEV2011 TaxID=1348973 RepID=A0A072NHL4_SCHAZ|nr:S-layer homology domain-containing protein [Schinkia azotoformans]KEF37179.1 putative S-layer protein [Schinkia azotoformans MEV2011]MEC1695455.1 S-layer homology domain-containing protein [Schinkia azotoformans]MEC1725735.1 S-layer homology domain-containing protein [Schinkia azotoformans]MEC1781777.1 S-layer homology domain-containing protein [Schinkia azotoformans]MED4329134.1 S-layer homology domain-containing protein [Schinkia azotoformans]